jgi:serine/threonine protein kinase
MTGHLKLGDMGAIRGVGHDGFVSAADNRESVSALKTAHVREERPHDGRRRMTITGTHGYRAPEIYDRHYSFEADWWSLGVLIIEMLTMVNPLRGENRKVSEHLTKTLHIRTPEWFTPETASIVQQLLCKDPTERLGHDGFERIKAHLFFSSSVHIDWVSLMSKTHPVPFDPATMTQLQRTPTTFQRNLTPETNQIDYFSQTVDYLAMSIKLRTSWVLSPDEQSRFEGFDYVSPSTIEEELAVWSKEVAERSSDSGREATEDTQQDQRPKPDRATY